MVVWAALFSEGGAISTMPVERPTISTSSCSQRNQLLSTGPLKQRAILLFQVTAWPLLWASPAMHIGRQAPAVPTIMASSGKLCRARPPKPRS